MTANIATVGLSRVTSGRPTESRIRLKRPVPGWNRVYQMNDVATAGTTNGMMNSARIAGRPRRGMSSRSARPIPVIMQTAMNPTVYSNVTHNACAPPLANIVR